MGYSEISWRQMPHKKHKKRSVKRIDDDEVSVDDVNMKKPNVKGKKKKSGDPTQNTDVDNGSVEI